MMTGQENITTMSAQAIVRVGEDTVTGRGEESAAGKKQNTLHNNGCTCSRDTDGGGTKYEG